MVFAAFGLFMGYLLPAENVMQILGPVLALLRSPVGCSCRSATGSFADIAKVVPDVRARARSCGPRSPATAPSIWAVVNVVGWAAVFVGGAAWRFRRDTARV